MTRQLGWSSLALMVALALRSHGLPLPLPGCPLRALTGVPCPTCFLTRSALATLHGDLGEALELHLFGPPLVATGLWLALVQGLLGRPLPAWRWGRLALAVAVALLIYWLLRLLGAHGLGDFSFPAG
ncbi:DUF2752 domain-containing protein [Cyanobium sp. ATX 6F1]|uniref:DUF2752 domain-containing protein n=1 Tax=Cyanobium sp. ATX 6F1 TaxID=2823702 RepID=UPI0028F3FA96|nr:DUF2752 domain-containing protein [Cyanobium sp. ATX 6F1]